MVERRDSGSTMTLYSTLWCKEKPGVPEDVTVLHRHHLGRRGVFRAVRRLQPGDAILLNGALGARDLWFDLLLAIYIRWFRRDVAMLISDATWHARAIPGASRTGILLPLYGAFLRALLLLTRGPLTHYGFLSQHEVRQVTREAGLRPECVHFTAFCSQLPLEIFDELQGLSAANDLHEDAKPLRFFSGGNTLRDYDTLIAAAADSDGAFTIATTLSLAPIPAHWRVGPMGHHDFFREMARCDVVVLPLWPADGRSSGQQTYLNALALGKPLIVTDVMGVRDHLVAGEHALVVPPQDAKALRAAIEWISDPAHASARAEMARKGRALAESMTFAHYIHQLCGRLAGIHAELNERLGAEDLPARSA